MTSQLYRYARLGAGLLAAVVLAGLARAFVRHLHAELPGSEAEGAGRWLGYGWLWLAAALAGWGLGEFRSPAFYWIARLGFAGFVICLIVAVYLAVVRVPAGL
jgi:hypothetical protein